MTNTATDTTRKFFGGVAHNTVGITRLGIPVVTGKITQAMDLLLGLKFSAWDQIELYETQEVLPTLSQAVCQIEILVYDPMIVLTEVGIWAREQKIFTNPNISESRYRLRFANFIGVELEFVRST